MKKALIITTINYPGEALKKFSEGAFKNNTGLVIVGDNKTPEDFKLDNCVFLNVDTQMKVLQKFSSVLPFNHYSRKNIGYLYAIINGADLITETDDDNIPYDNFWNDIPASEEVDNIVAGGWFNVYRLFSEENIWPRGFPLEYLHSDNEFKITSTRSRFLIVQGLADMNPDIDAVYRLTRKLPVNFNNRKPLCLSRNVWCPFNSQNTIFKKETFPLLYLPSFCSFRMTDIWRSLIAQRCLWELNEGVVFTSPTVYQERNYHNLLSDFEAEIPGYLNNDKISFLLDGLKLDRDDMIRNVFICYEEIINKGIIGKEELHILKAWSEEIEKALISVS
jgi:hypothetical protein